MLKSRLNNSEAPQVASGDLQSNHATNNPGIDNPTNNRANEPDPQVSVAYEMAYGLSHELNNPLANIAGRARLLAEQESDPERRMQLSIIVDQAMRGCEMIADLMLFARPPEWNPQHVDLGLVLAQVCSRGQAMAEHRNITIELQADVDQALVADRQAITEGLWAILRNALEVARRAVSVTVVQTPNLSIKVCDDGPGLSEMALQLAFHPYFSGREAGRGLGLGLSKARRIFSLCKATVAISNRANGGCEVNIEFSKF